MGRHHHDYPGELSGAAPRPRAPPAPPRHPRHPSFAFYVGEQFGYMFVIVPATGTPEFLAGDSAGSGYSRIGGWIDVANDEIGFVAPKHAFPVLRLELGTTTGPFRLRAYRAVNTGSPPVEQEPVGLTGGVYGREISDEYEGGDRYVIGQAGCVAAR